MGTEGTVVKAEKIMTPGDYEAPYTMLHLEKDRPLSGNSEKMNKLIQKSCTPSYFSA